MSISFNGITPDDKMKLISIFYKFSYQRPDQYVQVFSCNQFELSNDKLILSFKDSLPYKIYCNELEQYDIDFKIIVERNGYLYKNEEYYFGIFNNLRF